MNSNIEALIKNRRAVFPKQFNGSQVPNEVIEKMLELANWAPTHKNTEPWRFRVYTKNSLADFIDQCKECYVRETPAEKFKQHKLVSMEERKELVSYVIAISMQRHAELLPEFEEIASTAMAVQNMWLYLSSTEKYGGYWSTPGFVFGEDFSDFLKLDENEICLGIFYVGTIANGSAASSGKRGNWKEKVTFL